jgi:hypothetical protein
MPTDPNQVIEKLAEMGKLSFLKNNQESKSKKKGNMKS